MEPAFRKPLIVGNWKMHGTVAETIKWVTVLTHQTQEGASADVAIAPPFTALYSASVALVDTPILLAAQNLFWEDEGAYTGEISGLFLKDVGCSMVIVGHSERRRYFYETDAIVGQKAQAALKSDLIPIICIGESLEQREANKTFDVLDTQLKSIFRDIAMHDFNDLVLAYEPIWAIGTGKNATADQVGEVHHHLRTWLTKYYDAPTANRIRILYGGSVTPEIAPILMKEVHVDGLLVGGASLNPESFAQIVKFEERTR